jgi:hypothetical protein
MGDGKMFWQRSPTKSGKRESGKAETGRFNRPRTAGKFKFHSPKFRLRVATSRRAKEVSTFAKATADRSKFNPHGMTPDGFEWFNGTRAGAGATPRGGAQPQRRKAGENALKIYRALRP